MTCANCDAPFGLPRCRTSPYCSVRCHDQAKYVRYARTKRREHGDKLPADIAYALRIKRAHALGDGYDATVRHIPADVRREVWERDGGLCVMCGAPGEEIDHRSGSSNDPANLRVLCRRCHREITVAHIRPTFDGAVLLDARTLLARELAATPLRPCDAPDWEETWRAWRKAHALLET